jgi:hypothetical protein
MKKLALFFSYIFNPVLIPVYATLFYFLITLNYFHTHEVYLVFIQVLIVTVLLPASVFYLLRSLGLIKSRMLTDKNERRLPLAIYALLLFILIKHSLADFVLPELFYFFLGNLISIMAALALVLLNHKISLHVLGVSSLTVFVISISAYYHIQLLWIVALLITCCGFVASARLLEKEHTLNGIILGALIGIVPQVLLWFTWLFPVV